MTSVTNRTVTPVKRDFASHISNMEHRVRKLYVTQPRAITADVYKYAPGGTGGATMRSQTPRPRTFVAHVASLDNRIRALETGLPRAYTADVTSKVLSSGNPAVTGKSVSPAHKPFVSRIVKLGEHVRWLELHLPRGAPVVPPGLIVWESEVGTANQTLFTSDSGSPSTAAVSVALAPSGTSYLGPAWSPSKDRIAFVQRNNAGAANTTVTVMAADGSGLTSLYLEAPPNVVLGGNVAWTPDGLKIVCEYYSNVSPYPKGFVLVNADGSGTSVVSVSPLLSVDTGWDRPAVSPDGSKVVVTSTANANGTGAISLSTTPIGGGSLTPFYTPSADGSINVYASDWFDNTSVLALEFDSVSNRLLKVTTGGVKTVIYDDKGGPNNYVTAHNQALSPDGLFVCFIGAISGNAVRRLCSIPVGGGPFTEYAATNLSSQPEW